VVFSANPFTTDVFVVFGYLIGKIEQTDVTLINRDFNRDLTKLKVITGVSLTINVSRYIAGWSGRDTGTAILSLTPLT
jgi:hypothetical protein